MQSTPAAGTVSLPRHIVIVMDGNGRWARQRNQPRVSGHQAGVITLRDIVEHCARRGVEVLTVFAFSSENWHRPGREVRFLLELFMKALQQEVDRLHAHGVRLRFIGDRSRFSSDLQAAITQAEQLTLNNDALELVVAANYGGRWDITEAARQLAARVAEGGLSPDQIDAVAMQSHLSLHNMPEPDLFIRTGGEQRLSNFLLWQLAYTELYFTDCLWPDFKPGELDCALEWYASRQRRFGRISEQIEQPPDA